MDKKLKNYLLKLGFADDEIEQLCQQAPGLEIIDSERAFKNIAIVISYGYPKVDIDSLIFSNPGFLCNAPDDLDKTLKSFDGEIEDLLKSDPFLI